MKHVIPFERYALNEAVPKRDFYKLYAKIIPPYRGKPLYHGTSQKNLDTIMRGKGVPSKTFTESNVALGAAYFTVYLESAKAYARQSARASGEEGNGVVLLVDTKKIGPLLPDEDWVVRAMEEMPWDDNADAPKDKRYRGFFMQLMTGFDGNSLSDHYAKDKGDRFHFLNLDFEITWKDSIKYSGSCMQMEPLTKEMIKEVVKP